MTTRGLAEAALGFAAGLGGFEVRLFDREQNELLAEALDALGDDEPALRVHLMARLAVGLAFTEEAGRIPRTGRRGRGPGPRTPGTCGRSAPPWPRTATRIAGPDHVAAPRVPRPPRSSHRAVPSATSVWSSSASGCG